MIREDWYYILPGTLRVVSSKSYAYEINNVAALKR